LLTFFTAFRVASAFRLGKPGKIREIEIDYGKPKKVRENIKKIGILNFAHNSLKLLLYISDNFYDCLHIISDVYS